MTETKLAEPPGAVPAAMGPPADILTTLVVSFLAPMFLVANAGDIGIARQAAHDTINAFRVKDQADLLTIALIIAFGFAGLNALSLSMTSDVSLSMTLRLRGNAIVLNRAAQQNRRVLEKLRPGSRQPKPSVTEPEAEAIQADEAQEHAALAATVAALQITAAEARFRLRNQDAVANPVSPVTTPAPATTLAPVAIPAFAKTTSTAATGNRHHITWAVAMADAAEKLTASLAALPPIQRKAASIRATALTSTASGLLSGINNPPLSPIVQPLATRPNTV